MTNSLVNKKFWNNRHKRSSQASSKRTGIAKRLSRYFQKLRIKIDAEPHQSYPDYIFQKILKQYLPKNPGFNAIEIGCAPGKNLIMLNKLFLYQPFGVEYSSTGTEQTRRLFEKHNFNPANVIHTDFFDNKFQTQYRETFEIVISRGFIEHFDDPQEAIEAHLNLLKPGGYLICTIPNLKGFAWPILAILGRDILRAHNKRIMNLKNFKALFAKPNLEIQFARRFGVFQLYGMSIRHENSVRGKIVRLLDRTENILNHILFALLRGKAIETPLSPHFGIIAKKL